MKRHNRPRSKGVHASTTIIEEDEEEGSPQDKTHSGSIENYNHKDAEFRRWIRFELAALRIQRVYRNWRDRMVNQRSFSLYGRQSIGRYGLHSMYGMKALHTEYAKRLGAGGVTESRGAGAINFLPVGNAINAKRRGGVHGGDGLNGGTINHLGGGNRSVHASLNPQVLQLHSFQSILQENANIYHKFYFWRMVIDLRYNFPYLPTELLIKALIDAKGDVTRANHMLSNEDYCLQCGFKPVKHKAIPLYLQQQRSSGIAGSGAGVPIVSNTNIANDNNNNIIPPQIKMMFLPTLGSYSYQYQSMLNGFNGGSSQRPSSAGRHRMSSTASSSSPSRYGQRPSSASSTKKRASNIDMIKILRSQYHSRGPVNKATQKKEELMELFMNVIERTYFAKPPPPPPNAPSYMGTTTKMNRK